MLQRQKITFDKFVRGLIVIASVSFAIYLVNILSEVLLPFFIALLLAYWIYPLMHFLRDKLRLKNNTLSALLSMLLVLGVIGAGFYFLFPPFIEECVKAKDLFVKYIVDGGSSKIPKSLELFVMDLVTPEELKQMFTTTNIMNALKTLMPQLWNILSDSLNIVFSIAASTIVLLYLFLILQNYDSVTTGWIKLVPAKQRGFVQRVALDAEEGMNRYMRGQALVAFCTGVLSCIAFSIIQLPLAIGLGIIIGVLTIVPYLKVASLPLAVLLALLKSADTGESFWLVMGITMLAYAIVQAIEDGFLVPKIMGKITGLNPVVILLSLSIWGCLMGILGMIIAIPVTTLIISYYRQYIAHLDRINSLREKRKVEEEENENGQLQAAGAGDDVSPDHPVNPLDVPDA